MMDECKQALSISSRETLSYFFQNPGKGIRAALLIAFSKMFGYQGEKAIYLASCIEFIHGASLLHDDVIDNSDRRRNQAATHEVFGNKNAILTGDLAFALAQKNMNRSEDLEIIQICTMCLKEMVEGQIKELAFTGNCSISWADYREVLSRKTASLFRASCLIGSLLSPSRIGEATRFVAEFGTGLGMVFQMIDDVLDYSPDRKGKTLYSDFLEGKATGPAVIAYQKGGNKDRILLKEAFLNPSLDKVGEVLDLFHRLGALDQMREEAKEEAYKALSSLKKLPAGEVRDAAEEALHFCLSRKN